MGRYEIGPSPMLRNKKLLPKRDEELWKRERGIPGLRCSCITRECPTPKASPEPNLVRVMK